MSETLEADYDLVVVGTGAGGLLAALRCHDLGMKVLVIEKSHYIGGTSALSGGGFWVPFNHLMDNEDDRETASAYLRTIMRADATDARIAAFLDNGPSMVRYLEEAGLKPAVFPLLPDYFSEVAGAKLGGRGLYFPDLDAARLGEAFDHLREPSNSWKLFNRYVIDMADGAVLASRSRGWLGRAIKIVARYWLDIPWRLKTRRDRRLTLGNALIGNLLIAVRERGIRIERNLGLTELMREGNAVTGLIAVRDGIAHQVRVGRGVLLAAGGFEHNQAMRDAYLPVPTTCSASLTPGTNTGDTLVAARAIGADTEFLDQGWWFPVVQLPLLEAPDKLMSHILFRMPHMVCVNRQTERFTNESAAYDRMGRDMIRDQIKTGANAPCWMIFDATFRAKYMCGSILPTILMPDWMVPAAWWDAYIYRAPTLAVLADKIALDPNKLEGVVQRMNSYAAAGTDPEFGRGGTDFDRIMASDLRVKPNPALGPIDRPPFYAIRVDLGDLGTKGGLRVDQNARVLTPDGTPLRGLYAVGNCSGSIFGDAYPGPGGTLGPAMTFAFIAANDIAASP